MSYLSESMIRTVTLKSLSRVWDCKKEGFKKRKQELTEGSKGDFVCVASDIVLLFAIMCPDYHRILFITQLLQLNMNSCTH